MDNTGGGTFERPMSQKADVRLGRKKITERVYGGPIRETRQGFGLDLTHKVVRVILQRKTRVGINDTGACLSL